MTVTISELGTDRNGDQRPTHVRNCRTDDRHEAMNLAISSVYGKRAFFQQDSGLLFGYGQIFRQLHNSSGFEATSVTGRVRIDWSA